MKRFKPIPVNQLKTRRALAAFMAFVAIFTLLNVAWMLRGESAVEADTTWQRIQAQRVMTVGVDISFAPYGIYDPAGPIGIDPDVAQAIGALWGVEVRFVLVNYDGMYDSLLVGDVDMLIAGVRPEPQRAAAARYTAPYFDGGQVLVGTTGLPDELQGLHGAMLGVIFASDGDIWARDYLAKHEGAFVRVRYDDRIVLQHALATGDIQYALLDTISAYQAQQQHPDWRIAAETVVPDPVVIVVRRSDWKLYAELQGLLDDFHADGTLKAIILRWL